ncbi:hypothetical protein V4C53_35580 [Paraburkholderia azotifigens]|uniref:hypothetical protein n=1 Tax=Paraburkholderia azotifigens TaxID=2057004 RepID=UPI00317DC947
MAERRFSLVQPGDGSGNQFDSGGGGGDDGGMEARMSALEAANLETRDRLIKIETRLDAIASKEDLALTRAALQEAINAQTWKLVTFVCSFGTALVAATYFIAQHFK